MEENKTQGKLSYDQLKEVAGQLSQQNQKLSIMLQEANMNNAFNRLNFLFKVLEHKNCFDTEFVISCSEEIKDMMTPPAEEANPEKGA